MRTLCASKNVKRPALFQICMSWGGKTFRLLIELEGGMNFSKKKIFTKKSHKFTISLLSGGKKMVMNERWGYI